MESPSRDDTRFWADFRRFFLRGLSAIVPPLITLAILMWAFNFVDNTIGAYVTRGLRTVMASDNRKPEWVTEKDALIYGEPIDEFTADQRQMTREYKALQSPDVPEWYKSRILWTIFFTKYHWIGLLLGLLLIYVAGHLLGSFLGRGTWRLLERSLFRIPIVKAVYPHVKQVTDMILSEKSLDVSAVVAIEFPRTDCWALGLVVGDRPDSVSLALKGDYVRVFVMMSPTPFSGHPIWVRRSEVIRLPMTLDEAVRFCVSCGVVTPDGEEVMALPTKSPWRSKDEASADSDASPLK